MHLWIDNQDLNSKPKRTQFEKFLAFSGLELEFLFFWKKGSLNLCHKKAKISFSISIISSNQGSISSIATKNYHQKKYLQQIYLGVMPSIESTSIKGPMENLIYKMKMAALQQQSYVYYHHLH